MLIYFYVFSQFIYEMQKFHLQSSLSPFGHPRTELTGGSSQVPVLEISSSGGRGWGARVLKDLKAVVTSWSSAACAKHILV